MLQVFSLNIYVLLDSGTTLSFVTPLVARKFDILPDILIESFKVTTPVGELVVAKEYIENCPIILPNRVTHVEQVELCTVDFDVILGMDWLCACFSSIDCMTRLVKFNFPNEPVVEWKVGSSIPRGRTISSLKACNIISEGCLYNIVRVKDFDSEIPPIELVLVVRESQEVFLNDLPKIPLEWEIDFVIDLLPDTNIISIPPYRMARPN